MVAGLRSNPKFCSVEDIGDELAIHCGFPCSCVEFVDSKDRTKYNEAVRAGIAKVIKKHDQWMKAAKRNRIRARNTRPQSIQSDRVWLASGRTGRFVFPRGARNSLLDFVQAI